MRAELYFVAWHNMLNEIPLLAFDFDTWSIRTKVVLPTLVLLSLTSFIYVFVFASLFIQVKNDAFSDHKMLISIERDISYAASHISHVNPELLQKLILKTIAYQQHVAETDSDIDEVLEFEAALIIAEKTKEFVDIYQRWLGRSSVGTHEFRVKIESIAESLLNHVSVALEIVQEEADEDLQKLLIYEVVSSLILFTFVMLLVLTGINQVVRPLIELRQNIETFRNSQIDDISPIVGDEIKLLVKSFDLMKQDIILKREQIEKALEDANKANKVKSEFLANISHELRTPMLGILGFSELGISKLERVDKDKLLKYFERINSSGSRLLGLLNNLLDLSKLEAGQMQFDFSSNSIDAVIKQSLVELEPLLQQRKLVILQENKLADQSADFDQERIHQVIYNILSNAIKFSPEQGEILITVINEEYKSCTRDEGVSAIRVSICDQGPGVPEDELVYIFNKFSQSSVTNTGAGGTGLGLSICKDIVDYHKGDIFAKNNQESGACFIVILPRNQLDLSDG